MGRLRGVHSVGEEREASCSVGTLGRRGILVLLKTTGKGTPAKFCREG